MAETSFRYFDFRSSVQYVDTKVSKLKAAASMLSSCSKRIKAGALRDWSFLSLDLLSCSILSKLSESPRDIIRFGAVCKAFNLATKYYFDDMLEKKSHKVVPMLLFKSTGGSGELYCIKEEKFIDVAVPIPFDQYGSFCGYGYGWLAFKDGSVITLVNAFNHKSTIKLPPLDDTRGEELMYYDIRYFKVILSGDPCGEENCFVVAMADGREVLACTRPGNESWDRIITRKDLFKQFSDVIFYNGLLYGLTCNGKLVCVDVCNRTTKVLAEGLVAAEEPRGNSWFRLIESTKGDLLVAQRDDQQYKVYKLLIDHEQRRLIQKIEMDSNLQGDTLLIGRHHSMSCSDAGFATDSIYEANDHECTYCYFDVFSVKDQTMRSFTPHNSWIYHPAPRVWIVPPFQFHYHIQN